MLVRIVDGVPVDYSTTQLRRDNPQVSFPAVPSEETLAEYDVFVLVETDPPAVEDNEQAIAAEPILVNGKWTRQWSVVQKQVVVPAVISDRQFFHALAKQALISQDDALAAVATGTIPPSMLAIVDAIEDADARFDAKMFLSGAVEFRRDHSLVAVFASALGMSDHQVDDLFIFAASL